MVGYDYYPPGPPSGAYQGWNDRPHIWGSLGTGSPTCSRCSVSFDEHDSAICPSAGAWKARTGPPRKRPSPAVNRLPALGVNRA